MLDEFGTSARRRSLLGLALCAASSLPRVAKADAAPHLPAPEIEARSLDELHRDAMAEGGKLVVYAGGDIPNAYASLEASFKARFPSVSLIASFAAYGWSYVDRLISQDVTWVRGTVPACAKLPTKPQRACT